MKRLLLFIALASVSVAAPYYPPDNRFGVYSANVTHGVVGGIPTRAAGDQFYVTDYGWSVSNTAAQNSTALSNALTASTVGSVVHIPAGTYAFNGFNMDWTRSNRTVRGAGSGAGGTTLVLPNNSQAFRIGSTGNINYSNPSRRTSAVTALGGRGSNTITIANTVFHRGFRQIYQISFTNETTTPIISTNSKTTHVRSIEVVATSQSGNTLTLSQPLPSDFALAMAMGGAVIDEPTPLDRMTKNSGIEDINFDCTAHGLSAPVDSSLISYSEGCWVKGIKLTTAANYPLSIKDSMNFEVRGSSLIGISGGTSRGGVFLTHVSNGLVEDNEISGSPSLYCWISTVNNVVAYNWFSAHVNANHNVWSSHNLYEGNVWSFLISDGFYGGSSEDTLFRNWSRWPMVAALKRMARNYNLIGNMAGLEGGIVGDDNTAKWGLPNLGNESYTGTTVKPSAGIWWPDWDTVNNRTRQYNMRLTARSTDYVGVVTMLDPAESDDFEAMLLRTVSAYTRVVNAFGMQYLYFGARSGNTWPVNSQGPNATGAVLPALDSDSAVIPGTAGYQEKDLDVLATAIQKANWYLTHGGAIKSGEELEIGETIPDSYFRSSKPAFFGSLAWPAYDPINPRTPSAEHTPSGYRAENAGSTDYLGLAAPSFSTHPTTQTATVGDTVTLTVAGGGNPAPALQWRKGGSNISGATSSSLVLTNVQLADAGSYDCVATNTEGTATSTAATLTVNAAPSEGGTATIQTLNVGTLNIQ
jgi:hypothetical protein